MKNILIKIASIATELDYAGLTKEAKQMDSILLKLANFNMKPEFRYSSIPTDMAIDRMANSEKILMYTAMQSHVGDLKAYLSQKKLDLKKVEFSIDEMVKEYKKKYDENQPLYRIMYGPEHEYIEDYIKSPRVRVAILKREIKEIEDEINMFEAKMRELNKHYIYHPDDEYDELGYRLKKRTIFDKFLARDPKRDPNF